MLMELEQKPGSTELPNGPLTRKVQPASITKAK